MPGSHPLDRQPLLACSLNMGLGFSLQVSISRAKATLTVSGACLTVVNLFARDASAPSHSHNGSYGETALDVRSWQEEEEIVQANRRCQDMEYT